jgi:hypothetical protein
MDPIPACLILFALGFITAPINVGAGGGSTLTLPALIFLGLDSAVANGSNRLAVLAQGLASAASFRNQKVFDFALSLKLSACTLPGAVLGAWLAVDISNLWFNRILGLVMIGVIATFFLPSPKSSVAEDVPPLLPPWLIYPVMIAIGFYGGFIQAGVGFLLMAAMRGILGMDLVRVNMHKVTIVFVYTIPITIIFSATGNVHWLYGIALSVGSAAGGWWGAALSVKKGERWIRVILIVAIVIMAIRLLTMG